MNHQMLKHLWPQSSSRMIVSPWHKIECTSLGYTAIKRTILDLLIYIGSVKHAVTLIIQQDLFYANTHRTMSTTRFSYQEKIDSYSFVLSFHRKENLDDSIWLFETSVNKNVAVTTSNKWGISTKKWKTRVFIH